MDDTSTVGVNNHGLKRKGEESEIQLAVIFEKKKRYINDIMRKVD